MKQQNLFKIQWQHRLCHGGRFRNKAAGRMGRPLSTRDPLHLVIKSNFRILRGPRGYALVQRLVRLYTKKFQIKIEQLSIQSDHAHLLIRASKRSNFHSFFRVLSGQISQRLTDTFTKKWEGREFWKCRPFSRVVKGWRAYKIVRDYIQLNEKEGRGEIPYQRDRLKGLSAEQLQYLWI